MTRSRFLVPALTALAVVLALVAAYLIGARHDDQTTSSARPLAGAQLAADVTGSSTVPSGITVSGTGTATGTPDTLALDLAVTSTAATVTKALGEANASASAVLASLKAHGVAEKDLQTSGLSIQAQYDAKGQSITGYQVSESVRAVIHGLAKAGDTITAAVSAGGNSVRVNDIGLDLGDTGPLMTQARSGAFAQAKAKAEQYASAAGASLGRVVSITDVAVTSSPVPYAADAYRATASGAAPAPIAAGSKDVSVTVTVVFALA